jgi:hypothetical protein
MLARVLSAAVNGIEAFPVEVVNSGWGDTVVVIKRSISPILQTVAVGSINVSRAE